MFLNVAIRALGKKAAITELRRMADWLERTDTKGRRIDEDVTIEAVHYRLRQSSAVFTPSLVRESPRPELANIGTFPLGAGVPKVCILLTTIDGRRCAPEKSPT